MELDTLKDDVIVTEENAFSMLEPYTNVAMNDFSEYFKIITGREITNIEKYMFQAYSELYCRGQWLIDDKTSIPN